MKANRRHELKTNELSVYIEQVQAFLKRNATSVLVIAVVLVCLIGGISYRAHARTQALEQGWQSYREALRASAIPDDTDPEWISARIAQWEEVIAAYDEPSVRGQALWALADFCLNQFILSDGEKLKGKLMDKAEECCKEIRSDEYGSRLVLQSAALNALAAIEQNRFVLDRDPAHKEKTRQYLETIRNGAQFLGTPFQAAVLERLNQFDQMWETIELAEAPPAPPVGTPLEGPPMPAAMPQADPPDDAEEVGTQQVDDPGSEDTQQDSDAESDSQEGSEQANPELSEPGQ